MAQSPEHPLALSFSSGGGIQPHMRLHTQQEYACDSLSPSPPAPHHTCGGGGCGCVGTYAHALSLPKDKIYLGKKPTQ